MRYSTETAANSSMPGGMNETADSGEGDRGTERSSESKQPATTTTGCDMMLS